MNTFTYWQSRAWAMVLLLACTSPGACSDDEPPVGVDTPVLASPWPEARTLDPAAAEFPSWSHAMRLWPFDVLRSDMTDGEIAERLDTAHDAGATAVIFYLEEEQMYASLVDDAGFANMLDAATRLVDQAGARDLRTLVYLNGLEVMTRGAVDGACQPTGVPTLASTHPEWLQRGLDGTPLVFSCVSGGWLEPDWEDAWVSPFSGFRDLLKDRISQLATAGVDGVYIDATFLPGLQLDDEHTVFGSTDPAFAAAFETWSGLDTPTGPDFGDPAFIAFLAFRHEAIAEYLADLGSHARSLGLVPFWESSTGDSPEASRLGNDTAVTGLAGLGCSPEIEPEGDYLAAFRMAKAARELNHERPMIYLGWPESRAAAATELALALAHSNTYYPTADSPLPTDAFGLMDRIAAVLSARVPYSGGIALAYSSRNQDQTFPSGAFFDAYDTAFRFLAQRHIPFRILPLESASATEIHGLRALVLPGIEAISDVKAGLLTSSNAPALVTTGAPFGTREETGAPRATPLSLGELSTLDSLRAALPFELRAPASTVIEFYGDRDGGERMYLFAVSPDPGGTMVLHALPGKSLHVEIDGLGLSPTQDDGAELSIPLKARLVVVSVSPSQQ